VVTAQIHNLPCLFPPKRIKGSELLVQTKLVGRVLYNILSTQAGLQFVREEYCDISQVSISLMYKIECFYATFIVSICLYSFLFTKLVMNLLLTLLLAMQVMISTKLPARLALRTLFVFN
jgi:hypothetical protein